MSETKIFAVTGNPVMHSKSPGLHNAAFQNLGIDATYTRLAAGSAEEALQIAKEIGMSGLNVTAPFKEEMTELMDSLDKSAEQIGAVNTLLLKNGKVVGYNTDGYGVVKALKKTGMKISGKQIIVLGAGGAAKAAVAGLSGAGAKVTIANRTSKKAEELARKFGCEVIGMEELAAGLKKAEGLVSCISSGGRIVERSALHSDLTVLDANYSEETVISSDAKKTKCKFIDGTEWLLFQAIAAFKLFTGKEAPVEVMRKALNEKQNTNSGSTANIALIGFMGSGKTLTAESISKKSKKKLVDIDANIEKNENAKIKEIIETRGILVFREMENRETEQIHNYNNTIIACGGGTVLNPTNCGILKQKCKTIWLWAKPEEVHKRTKHDGSRPLLDMPDRKKAIQEILERRIGIYAECADLVIGTEGKTPEETTEVILNEIKVTEEPKLQTNRACAHSVTSLKNWSLHRAAGYQTQFLRSIESGDTLPGLKPWASGLSALGEKPRTSGKTSTSGALPPMSKDKGFRAPWECEVDGSIVAPASKSMMQRAVAAALLANGRSKITNPSFCEDSLAALEIIQALGAKVERNNSEIVIEGIGIEPRVNILNCSESGLCMRMFSAIAALSNRELILTGKPNLLARPVGMIEKPLEELGAVCKTNNGNPPVSIHGKLKGGHATVDGSESSQFLTGLLMALPVCEKDSELEVRELKSKPYVQMTLSLLEKFGIIIGCNKELSRFEIKGNQKYKPVSYEVEGDWSGAAFLLVAGAIAGRVKVRKLLKNSLQADKAIVEALKKTGALVTQGSKEITVQKDELLAFEFDATNCPDLFPPLVALACNCKGTSRITGVERLRHKESNRAEALKMEFGKLGAQIEIRGNQMLIAGVKLTGGKVDSHNDHRIAMACAIAGLNALDEVKIENYSCVSKSYPEFFKDLESLMKVK